MNNQSILQRLQVICPTLATRLQADRPLRESGLDSLELVDLLCAIEAEFNVRLTTAELTPELTVGQLTTLIASRAR